MSSEEFDKKLREAADRHHPAYKEEAWKRMNQLLDKHMPEEEKDRKPVLWIFLVSLFLVGGILFVFLPAARKNVTGNTGINNLTPSSETTHQLPQEKDPLEFIPGSAANEKKPESASPRNLETLADLTTDKSPVTNTPRADKPGKKTRAIPTPKKAKTQNKKEETIFSGYTIESSPSIINSPSGDGNANPIQASSVPDPEKEEAADEKKEQNSSLRDDSSEKGKTDSASISPLVQKPAGKKSKTRFAFSLSVGPDLSFASGKAGSIQPVKGIGLSYSLSDRFTLRTGFFTARKIYTAAGKDYKAGGNFANYYPNLNHVDGDCIVYEIPLFINYNFGHKATHSWFVSTGLSSLLMKKEEYNYYYKPWGSSYMHKKKWETSNTNKHLFSQLSISGGYTKTINRNVFWQVEPYLRLPLSGVGEGKLNLKSAGVLGTIGISF